MINRHYFNVAFAGQTLRADSSYGNNGHIVMIHGGSKDREVFAHYRQQSSERYWAATLALRETSRGPIC